MNRKNAGGEMLTTVVDRAIKPLAGYLQAQHMKRLGIANTMRLAGALNALRHHRQLTFRKEQYRKHFAELIRENGASAGPFPQLGDGWVLDHSQALPHLPRLLEDAAAIIDERGGMKRKKPGAYRSFFQNILEPGDLAKYPSLLDFAVSSEVLSAVSNYLQCIPALATNLPGGVRFAESNIAYDDHPETLKDSQLFHIDYFSRPSVYVIVLLHDVTIDHGPFCFLPAAASQHAAAALKYWARGRPYRLTDDEIYSVVDRNAVIPMTRPKGTVLFLDPSACFHFGSRNCIKTRYQLMYAFGTGCRTDLNEFVTRRHVYPDRPGDSRLARMVFHPETCVR
jgi:hypothetical protein